MKFMRSKTVFRYIRQGYDGNINKRTNNTKTLVGIENLVRLVRNYIKHTGCIINDFYFYEGRIIKDPFPSNSKTMWASGVAVEKVEGHLTEEQAKELMEYIEFKINYLDRKDAIGVMVRGREA